MDWIPTPWNGRVGLTFAPGKKQAYATTGAWDRDLLLDLGRLAGEYGARHLVCLLQDHELAELRIPNLEASARAVGIALHRYPIQDGDTPESPSDAARLVSRITGWAAAGENVVVHCKGGLGRAGTIGGCVLRAAGRPAGAALEELATARGPACPETPRQRRFIEEFVPVGASTRSRILGCVIAAAVGDALGHPTEFLGTTAAIRRRYPPAGVTGFELWWERDGRRFAPYTDDTQMAEIVLRSLLNARRAEAPMETAMEEMAGGFARWRESPQGGHRAPGNACLAGAERLALGIPWRGAGGAEAGGCGSVMRAYPFGLLGGDELPRIEHWAVEHSRMTHQHPIALAACAAMAVGVALELAGEESGGCTAQMVEAAGRHDAGTASMAQQAVAAAAAGEDPDAVLAQLQGWAAHEAVAAAMFVVARHPRDLRGALLEGANSPGDSDSIATLAGALLGARLGLEAVPADWSRDVERSVELHALASEVADALAAT